MRKWISVAAFLLVALTPELFGQQGVINHIPSDCIPAEQYPLLVAQVETEGIPRCYFRRQGAEDWCWVDGTRIEQRAIFILPRFENGATIEYYFLTLQRAEESPATVRTEKKDEVKPLLNDRLLRQLDEIGDDETAVVTGKSPMLYHARATQGCISEAARHIEIVTTNCRGGDLAAAIGASYLLSSPPGPGVPSPSIPNE